MNWPQLIAQIQLRGLTQVQIAAHCGCSQVAISDLARGKSKQPAFDLGMALTGLRDASDQEMERIRGGARRASAVEA